MTNTDTAPTLTEINEARRNGTTPLLDIPACELQPGDVLRNGYVIVAVVARSLSEAKVLAVRPDDSEYASWMARSSANTFWGHYNHDFAAAVEDFLAR